MKQGLHEDDLSLAGDIAWGGFSRERWGLEEIARREVQKAVGKNPGMIRNKFRLSKRLLTD